MDGLWLKPLPSETDLEKLGFDDLKRVKNYKSWVEDMKTESFENLYKNLKSYTEVSEYFPIEVFKLLMSKFNLEEHSEVLMEIVNFADVREGIFKWLSECKEFSRENFGIISVVMEKLQPGVEPEFLCKGIDKSHLETQKYMVKAWLRFLIVSPQKLKPPIRFLAKN